MRERRPGMWRVVPVAILLLARVAAASEAADGAAARWLESVRPSAELQEFLDRTIEASLAHDAPLRTAKVRVALLDLAHGEPPRLAANHGDAPIDHLDGQFDHAVVFLVREGGGFTGGAAGHNPARPVGNLPFYKVAEGPLVDFTIPKGSYNGNQCTRKHAHSFAAALTPQSRNAGIVSPFTKSSYVSLVLMTWISPSLIRTSGTRGLEL